MPKYFINLLSSNVFFTLSNLKNKIRVHAGLKKQRKMKLINEILKK